MLSRTFGCVRVVWNRTLAWRQARWSTEKRSTSFPDANAHLTAMKGDSGLAWLNEVSSVPLQQVLRMQEKAFAGFFAKRARYPRFKNRSGRQRAEYTKSAFRWRDGRLWLAKMDAPLQLVWSWPDVDRAAINPSTVTVSRDPDGRWYVSLTVEVADPQRLPQTDRAVGVDMGVKDFAVTSDGVKIANPRMSERKGRNLARFQRRMARKQRGSANRAKARTKLARAHRKIRAARQDFLHRTSTNLVREYDVIAIEDLQVENMVKNRKLSRAISDSAWGAFRRMLEYKAAKWGRTLVVINRWYPSSKTCSSCGYLLDKLSLATRTWACPGCGALHDRDINAAKNILAAGLAVTACGADVRHSESTRVQLASKQESQPVTVRPPDA